MTLDLLVVDSNLLEDEVLVLVRKVKQECPVTVPNAWAARPGRRRGRCGFAP